jgi:hypothetical protein
MKTVFSLLIIFGLFTALSAQQVESGKFSANSSMSGYTLHENEGERSYTMEVTFAQPFDKKPEVIVAVSLVDGSKETNLRYQVEANAVSRDGFLIKMRTWSDSKIYGLAGSWIAVSGN